jgi:hypothetical protein
MAANDFNLKGIGQPLADSNVLISTLDRLEEIGMLLPVSHGVKHGSDDTRAAIKRAAEEAGAPLQPSASERLWRILSLP